MRRVEIDAQLVGEDVVDKPLDVRLHAVAAEVALRLGFIALEQDRHLGLVLGAQRVQEQRL